MLIELLAILVALIAAILLFFFGSYIAAFYTQDKHV
jgi:Na+-driven multidrug efflux pump